MKRFVLILLSGFLLINSAFALNRYTDDNKVQYEQKLEANMQRMIDLIIGPDKSHITIDIDIEPFQSNVKYTNQAEVSGQAAKPKSKKYLMPGVPALKNIGSEDGATIPFDYTEEKVQQRIKKITVTLLMDQALLYTDIIQVKKFVEEYLGLNKTRDKINVIKKRFNVSKVTKESTISIKDMPMQGAGAPQGPSGQKDGMFSETILMYGAIGFGVLVVIIMIILSMMIMMIRKKEKPASGAGMGGMGGAMGAMGAEMAAGRAGGGAGGGMGGAGSAAEVVAKQKKKEDEIGTRKFFKYINEDNIHKLKHLLQIKIAMDEASPKTIAMVMACLPAHLATMILVEYPPKIQAEIVSILVDLEQYDEPEVIALEKEVAEKISTLLGGKYTMRNLIESLSTENKRMITTTIARKFPQVLDEIRDLIILFEDILALPHESVKLIFGEMDPVLIATALSKETEENVGKILDVLPKGTQEIVQQWVELKGQSASYMDIEEAQQQVIEFAKKMELEGRISIDKIDFLKESE